MERTWRWFGKNDKITLAMLKEIGVQGIVTALHDVPNGEVWSREKISDLRKYIESYGMRWSVVESLPVCESIKYAGHDLNLENLCYFVERIPWTDEVSIGHALICDALYYGLENTVRLYRRELAF